MTTKAPYLMELIQGSRLSNRFKVVGSLGSGTLGSVLLASDGDQDDQLVVLKSLPRKWPKEIIARLFERAARALRVKHGNLVSVIGSIDSADLTALCFEYVDGHDLAAYLRLGKISVQEAVAILLEISCAAEELHRHGIVGIRLKPSNILLSSEGAVKLSDWIIRATELNPRGETSHYSAPEVKDSKSAGPQSDVYTIGVLGAELAQACSTEELSPESAYALGEFKALLLKCISASPADRPQSMAEVRTQTERIYRRLVGAPLNAANTAVLGIIAYIVLLLGAVATVSQTALGQAFLRRAGNLF